MLRKIYLRQFILNKRTNKELLTVITILLILFPASQKIMLMWNVKIKMVHLIIEATGTTSK
jgi:hypothetical protein